ncbi:MAG: putative DNA-binding domain-containing protein [Acidobacteria bacterium]|nr:putative DNA-binding domain-containing protein [Acidobacteriota bacterium]
MSLAEFQRRMAADLMAPMSVIPDAGYVKPNDRLSSAERLDIYHRQYWYRVIDSMYEDFPGLCAVIGQRAFDRLIEAYLAEHPSQSFTMRDLGSRLEAWLRGNPHYAGRRPEFALDMVRLEWAHVVAFDGPSKDALGPEDLLEPNPEMRLGLQPYISLLDCHYPVDEIRIKVNATLDEHGDASNASTGREHRTALRNAGRRKPKDVHIAVHRWDLTVYYRRLAREELCLLAALRDGATLAEAIDRAFESSPMPIGEIPQSLAAWFNAWSALGWLCRP